MVEDFIPKEKESFMGLSTLELSQVIVSRNEAIRTLYLRPFTRPSLPEETQLSITRRLFLGVRQYQLQEWAEELGDDYNIALDSNLVLEDGSTMHIPMLDLSIPSSEENLERARSKFCQLIVPEFGGGYLLKSGASYHFLGERLLAEEEWTAFLGTSLLTAIITQNKEGINYIERRVVDDLYVGHSLKRGESGLRLTTNQRKQTLPQVVAFV